ncbi:photosystem I reaction center subunit V [Medicago truncatula]|uniref:Photosystem I reaction center subunit V, chloroplastic n=1 Tax=Medicago truncatula TaxID=3880 RepID=G7J0E0_MEDTR|nr:photosystem I reaction center subunit V [Medicago truncatula]
MAASASSMISTHALTTTIQKHKTHNLKPSSLSFQGFNPLTRSTKVNTFTPSKKRFSSLVVKAELNPSLERFVFFNFQRENVAKQGLPEQNGVTHFEAGDKRAKEYVSLLKSNDPVGFNLVDVLAWGSLGHIVAYYILATSSNGYDPSFFG